MDQLSLSDRERLIDEMISANRDANIGDYLRELKEIENEINDIQINAYHDKDQT